LVEVIQLPAKHSCRVHWLSSLDFSRNAVNSGV
jgi:hypothetical protein